MKNQFKVIAVSTNTNSFGLYQFVCLNEDGHGYKAHANYLNVPKQGDIIAHPTGYDFELITKLPQITVEMAREILNGKETIIGALSPSAGFPRGMSGVTNPNGLPLPLGS